MNTNLNRFFTSPLADGTQYATVSHAVQALVSQAPTRRVLIITKELQHREMIENLIGKTWSKTKANPFPGTGVNIVHQSLKNINSIADEVVLTLGLDSDDLLFIEPDLQGQRLLSAPWYPGELDKWAKITGALELSTGQKAVPFQKPDCLLQQAMLSMKGINTGNHLHLHDLDRNQVKTVFTEVFRNHLKTDRDMLEAFLYVSFGWPKDVIENVLKIHDALKKGKIVQGELRANAHELYNRWQEACKES